MDEIISCRKYIPWYPIQGAEGAKSARGAIDKRISIPFFFYRIYFIQRINSCKKYIRGAEGAIDKRISFPFFFYRK